MRLLWFVLGTAIAVAGIYVSAKPLLIKYLLYKYDRASANFSRLYDHSSDTSQLAEELRARADIMHDLSMLNYLTTYDIPIHNPRSDVEDLMLQISSGLTMHKVPISWKLVKNPSGTVMRIMDQPENKANWAWIAQFYFEQTPEQQSNDPNHKGPILIHMP